MKNKDELQRDAGFVRDVVAQAQVDFPASDFERDLRDAMFRKAYSDVPAMEITHVRRLHEALCGMKFPTSSALGLRQALMIRLAEFHELKRYRTVKMPAVTMPAKG